MDAHPNAEESYTRLHRSGWSIGDVAFIGPAGHIWLVSGHNGENLIRADGPTRDAAWHAACQQAEAVGMLTRGLSGQVGLPVAGRRKTTLRLASPGTRGWNDDSGL